jgi:hypothetical protein
MCVCVSVCEKTRGIMNLQGGVVFYSPSIETTAQYGRGLVRSVSVCVRVCVCVCVGLLLEGHYMEFKGG